MAVEIALPQLSDTMNEGKILRWFKKEGDVVKRGEALAEVATDKADLEIEAFHAGVLLKLLAPVGASVKVGAAIAIIGEAGEFVDTNNIANVAAPAPVAPVASAEPPVATAVSATAVESASPTDERIKASPLARNVAQSHGIDIAQVQGSGEGGRIVRRDVESFVGGKLAPVVAPAPAAEAAPVAAKAPVAGPAPTSGAVEMLSSMRQTIASRMVESKTTIPHFYVTAKINAAALVQLRTTLKPLPYFEGLTYNHFILEATGLALRAVPRMNASFRNGGVYQPQGVNVGIVTAVPDGLLIPVLKNADQLAVADIVAEAKSLVQRARAGRPKADDLMGGTFSVSNMGMFPVESFSAIISPGQGGILAVSAIVEEPIVDAGQVRAGQVMRVSVSVDHRVIDGVVAGEFLKELKRLLEEPVLLLV